MGHPDVNFVDLYKKSAFANNACQIASKEVGIHFIQMKSNR
jgi:hypothetical protein